MKLSEAILYGRTLRPESHQEGHPFVRVLGDNGLNDELRSDVWGAAVEAVHSLIAKRSWTDATYQADMAYFIELQQRYFGDYFKLPAICPGASPRPYVQQGARMTGDRQGSYVIEGEKQRALGPITDQCPHVVHLAGFVEHAFYVHNWSSEQVAQAVEWYEQQQQIVVAQTFEHYQDESLRQSIAQRVVAQARQREMARHQRRNGNRSYVH
jgi:hypothetical protein